MSLYSESDKSLLIEHIDEIIRNADHLRNQQVEPTEDKMWDILMTVKNFVVEKKRKIYGGFALNKLIELVEPKDKFYDDKNVKDWDIDFYSPDPIGDAREISNRLYAKKYLVRAGEAQHDETYKIFADTIDCADITYVPRNIYNKIPFKEVGGMIITGSHFMAIDYFRALSDPLTSYFRLEKSFVRLCLMLHHYPMPNNASSIDIVEPDRDLDVVFHTIHDFLTDSKTCITVGMYPYNHLIHESHIMDRVEKKATRIKYVNVNYYEIITTDYVKDAKKLIKALEDKFVQSKNKITYQENYPFFQYLGYNLGIYYQNELVCKIYHYNGRCTPYFEVPALYFKNGTFDEINGTIRIGSVSTQMMYNLINIMKARADNDQNTKNLYYCMISHIIEMQNYYFAKTKKTILDDTLFQEFVLRCSGSTLSPQMEKQLRIERKRKAGKKYAWSYNPENAKDRENHDVYVFKNSSGNPIQNKKNMKIQEDSEAVDIDAVADAEE
jgi:hypothetical protein